MQWPMYLEKDSLMSSGDRPLGVPSSNSLHQRLFRASRSNCDIFVFNKLLLGAKSLRK